MGPIETRVLEILLAMSRGKALAELGFIAEAHLEFLKNHQLLKPEDDSLSEKGQAFVRLVKDSAAYWIRYGTRPS